MLVQLLLVLLYTISMVNTFEVIEAGSLGNVDERTTLRCHKREYEYKVSQVDKNGKVCWDTVRVVACWGRCVSSEIADFQFPYKKSTHPVCVHYGRNKAFVNLRYCDEGALPSTARYEYYEAADCKCQQCSSMDTSCEGMRFRSQHSEAGGFKRIVQGDDDSIKFY